jgi:hypothetical protein
MMKKTLFILLCAYAMPAAAQDAHPSAADNKTAPVALEHGATNYWQGGTFHQTSIDLSAYGKGIVRADVEGRRQEFRVRELPQGFLDWDFKGHLSEIATLRNATGMPPLSGPHFGVVASHGLRRNDSPFALNNAVKGIGFIPKKEKLPEMLKILKDTAAEPLQKKLDILENFYTARRGDFDTTKLVSLELYSTPSFETHTFLNEMTDPGVSIVFMDMPSYDVRALAQLLSPSDPKLTDYEKQAVDWCNTIHDYFHGGGHGQSIAVIYHVIAVFDDTPGRGRGRLQP